MSAIDSYTHAHVANFFNLPVYWVLEPAPMRDLTYCHPEDLISPYFLSIGGGSGEHPALIIQNDAALLHLMRCIEDIDVPQEGATEEQRFDYQMYCLVQDITEDYLTDKADLYYWAIDTNQWPLETFVRIAKESEQYKATSVHPTTDDLESKILYASALFIIHEMPLEHCIEDEKLRTFAQMYRSGRWQKAFDYSKMRDRFLGFTGILECQKAGKVLRNGKAVWGYSLSDWKRDHLESEHHQ